jgi:hypothetical protein
MSSQFYSEWRTKLRFSTLEHDLVRLRSLDDRREGRSRISLPEAR